MRETMNGTPAYVLAFDSGPHTGVAWFRYGTFGGSELVVVDPVHADGQMRRLFELLQSGQSATHTVVVIENFHSVGPLTRDGVATVKLMGFVEGVARIRGYEVVYQMPSVRKPFLADAKLLVGRAHPHELDAAAHGLALIERRTGGLSTDSLVVHTDVPI